MVAHRLLVLAAILGLHLVIPLVVLKLNAFLSRTQLNPAKVRSINYYTVRTVYCVLQ